MMLRRFRVIAAAVGAAAGLAGLTAASGGPAAGRVVSFLASEEAGPGSVLLKLVLLNAGRSFAADAAVRLSFEEPGAPGKPVERPAPGPRSVAAPLACARWKPDNVEILSFGPFVLDAGAPAALRVFGRIGDEPPVLLGTLARDGKGEVRFTRAWPGGEPPAGSARVLAVAARLPLDPDRFTIKVAFLNCGEKLPFDYTAFLHFELAPTGQDLDRTIALDLLPSSTATDSAAWTEDDLAVVSFGPYTWPKEATGPIYLRAGLYDNRTGNGPRLPLAGPDDSGRALVGRLVREGDAVRFERAPELPALEVKAWR